MKKIIVSIVSMLLLGSCREEESITFTYLKNSTTHTIVILPYSIGIIDSTKLIVIDPNTQKEIDRHLQKGKSLEPVILSSYYKGVDSIRVVWDNTYIMVHMISDSFTSPNKYISFSDKHNIGYVSGYEKNIEKENKHSIIWNVTYTFTEQDYLDAKD